MLFTDRPFFLFLAVVFAGYYALFRLPAVRRYQSVFLILASFFFYAWEIPQYAPLLLISILSNAVVSWFIPVLPRRRARLLLWTGILLNLLLLSLFKYGGLFARSLAQLPGFSALAEFPAPVLPLGISFYTFQGLSLIIDAYRDEDPPVERTFVRHLHHTALLMSLFPHQIAGPIVKARLLFPQIGWKTLSDIDAAGAARALILGYFLKLVVADNMRDYTFWLDHPYYEAFSTPVLAAMLFGYSMQIFSDFAGYSLIAIGLARLFGYELCQNFNFPYLASSFREFWTRWHMSLSGWLREYLYIPLGGNRVPFPRQLLNVMLVMALGGLWHGTAWGFMLWGAVHGAFLVFERVSGRLLPPGPDWLHPLRVLFVFLCVSLCWSLFRLTDISHLTGFARALWTNTSKQTDAAVILGIAVYSVPVIGYHVLHSVKKRISLDRFESYLFGILLFFIITNAGSGARFIYFQF